jgi:hypothetical protein
LGGGVDLNWGLMGLIDVGGGGGVVQSSGAVVDGQLFFWISELQIGTNQGDGIRMFFSGDS